MASLSTDLVKDGLPVKGEEYKLTAQADLGVHEFHGWTKSPRDPLDEAVFQSYLVKNLPDGRSIKTYAVTDNDVVPFDAKTHHGYLIGEFTKVSINSPRNFSVKLETTIFNSVKQIHNEFARLFESTSRIEAFEYLMTTTKQVGIQTVVKMLPPELRGS